VHYETNPFSHPNNKSGDCKNIGLKSDNWPVVKFLTLFDRKSSSICTYCGSHLIFTIQEQSINEKKLQL